MRNLHPDWKKRLAATLKELGIIPEDFGGKIEMNLNSGGITSVVVPNTLK